MLGDIGHPGEQGAGRVSGDGHGGRVLETEGLGGLGEDSGVVARHKCSILISISFTKLQSAGEIQKMWTPRYASIFRGPKKIYTPQTEEMKKISLG